MKSLELPNVTAEQRELLLAVKSCLECAVETTKAMNFGRGWKGAVNAERRAVRALLVKVLGRKPTDEEVESMMPG